MPTELKAVVFRTSKLKETKDFFVSVPGLVIKESSVTHFVIHSKGIRLLFVESGNDLEVELYLSKSVSLSDENNLTLHTTPKISGLAICEDPNGIKIIISETSDNKKITNHPGGSPTIINSKKISTFHTGGFNSTGPFYGNGCSIVSLKFPEVV